MHYEIKKFWPSTKEGVFKGTVHIELPKIGIAIRGISVFFSSQDRKGGNFWISLNKKDYDREAIYPIFTFINREVTKIFYQELKKSIAVFIVNEKIEGLSDLVDQYLTSQHQKSEKASKVNQSQKKNNPKN